MLGKSSKKIVHPIRLYCLIGIIGFGLLIRLWGIKADLPFIYHPDEPVNLNIVHQIIRTPDLNPHFFNYPSLFFYIQSLSSFLYFVLGKIMGIFHSLGDYPSPMILGMGVGIISKPSLIIWSRFITVIFGLLSIILINKVATEFSPQKLSGLLAALFLAISPTNVRLSQTITPDVYVIPFILVTLWSALRIMNKGDQKAYLIGGISTGLAASVKYNGAFIGLIIVGAHLVYWGKDYYKIKFFYYSLILMVLAFLLSTPFSLLDFQAFWDDFIFEANHYATGHLGMEGGAFFWYIEYLWKQEGAILILGLTDLLIAFKTKSKNIILIGLFVILYYLFVGRLQVRNDRTILLITPLLCLLSADLLSRIWKYRLSIQKTLYRRAILVLFIMIIIVSVAIPLHTLVRHRILVSDDYKERARQWLIHNIPPGSKVTLESYSPYLDPGIYQIQYLISMIDKPWIWFRENDQEYLIMSSQMYDRYFREPERFAEVRSA